jgi:uncharacterized protein CbrC (UPF0167 family)
MYKKQAVAFLIFVCLCNSPGYASQESVEIRKDCEDEVQTYGLVDPVEIQQLVNDCVANLTDQSQQEQYDDFEFSDERT